ncbi:uncharacterized protein PF3D7_1120000-like [Euwallacea fornicatus]|uniref:uncharacterized protein PF3D7_1120000-like n=1 Tax=Euwallacea fornicatus TaxID=995702 RepID=UPI00338EC46F
MTTRQQKEDVTAQRTETLVPVGEAGEREGPHRPLSSDLSASQVRNQAEMSSTATETMEERRREEVKELGTPTIAQRVKKLSTVVSPSEYFTPGKTPSKEVSKNITFLDFTWDETEHKSVKRKRVEEHSIKSIDDSAEIKLKRKLKNLLTRQEKEIKHLRKVTRENQNTKKEIKEIAENLNSINSGIMTAEMQNIMFLEVREEVKEKVEKKVETASVGTQTESEAEGQVEERVLSEIGEINNLEEFLKVERMKWNEHLFTCTEIKVGNPLETDTKTVKVVWVEPGDPEMKRSVQSLYVKRFPDIMDFDDSFEVIEQTLRRKSGQQNDRPDQKIIKIKSEHSDTEIWNYLKKIRDETEGDQEVALHHLEDMSIKKLAKMVEVNFRGSGCKVTIYTTEGKRKREMENVHKVKQGRSYALIVNNTEEQFKETLKTIKEQLVHLPEKEAIKGIRKTRDGKLLITMERDGKALDAIKKEVQKGTKLNIRESGERTKRSSIHIRGMEATTTKEEVHMAIMERLNMEDDKTSEIKVGELRPNAYGTQAVTVNMKEEDVKKLMKNKEIRIGLVKCAAEEHVKVNRCFVCGSYEHIQEECKEDKTKKTCFKCGKSGHIYRECSAEESCLSCKTVGHAAGSGKCPVFRRALINVKKVGRQKSRQRSREEDPRRDKEEMEKQKEN